MTVQKAIDIIEDKIRNSSSGLGTVISADDCNRLTLAKNNLEKIKESALQKGELKVPSQLATLISRKDYTPEIISKIDSAVTEWQKQRDNSEKAEENPTGKKFVDLLPIIIAVIVLVVGLSLGLTVFNVNQDALYFTLESIKDIVGSAVSYLLAKQCVNQKNDKKNNGAIVIVGSIFGIAAFVFSIFLWVGSSFSIFERFTQWGKLTYLWVSLTLVLIVIICAVSIVWYLLTYSRNKETEADNK